MNAPYIKEGLIKKYLTGKASREETVIVEHFMQQEGAEEAFEMVWEELHQEMGTPPDGEVTDPVRMQNWKVTIRQKIRQYRDRQTVNIRKRRPFPYRQVAIWTIFILCGAIWGTSKFINKESTSDTEWITHVSPNGKRAVIRLTDSTVIYLGAGSSLKYPKQFAEHKREVKLEGEAFFEVAKDPDKPFSVVSGEVVTQVLGTSFKVESFAGTPTLVSVSTGKVRVIQLSEGQEQLLADLTAGQRVTWDDQLGVVKTNLTLPTSAEDFISGKFTFEDRPLAEIVEALKRNYNLDIEIQRPSLAKKTIRIVLEKNLTRQQMMEVIAAAGGFRYTLDKTNGNIKIF